MYSMIPRAIQIEGPALLEEVCGMEQDCFSFRERLLTADPMIYTIHPGKKWVASDEIHGIDCKQIEDRNISGKH